MSAGASLPDRRCVQALAAGALLMLAGCNGQLEHLGRPPPMTPPGSGTKLYVAPPTPERVALAPSPPVIPERSSTGSLWHSGPESLFGDRRARGRGDILTVVVEIDDEAEIENTTTRARAGSDEIGVNALYGLTGVIDDLLPGRAALSPGVSTDGTSSSEGSGAVTREEEITLRLAVTVENVLPNGHLAIRGSQEVRINFELRELQVSGIIRPEDISRRNEITSDKIADARIVYGGRGQISDLQQPRYGQQIVDLISPF